MDSLTYNMAIFPEDKVTESAISLSENLQKYGTLYTLQKNTVFPHVSLYRIQIKNSELEKVKERLSHIAESFQALDLEAIGYHFSDGFMEVSYLRTPLIEDLQMHIVNAINPLRDGMREKDLERLQTATGKVRDSLEKYGYWGIGELYKPHLSLTLFTENRKIDDKSLPDPQVFSGKFATLGLSEQGRLGTMIRKIAEFKLGGLE